MALAVVLLRLVVASLRVRLGWSGFMMLHMRLRLRLRLRWLWRSCFRTRLRLRLRWTHLDHVRLRLGLRRAHLDRMRLRHHRAWRFDTRFGLTRYRGRV